MGTLLPSAAFGMCPGPILVNIGEGKVYALAALAGALAGAGAFGTLYARLQVLFGLPSIGMLPTAKTPVDQSC